MVTWRDGVLGGALVLSIGANVWLVRREPAAAPRVETQERIATPGATVEARVQAPLAAARARREPTAGSAASGPCPELQAQLEATEAELDKFLPPNERYDRYPRMEASEVRIRPFLDAVFTDGGKGRGYEVECHDRVCKITIDKKVAREDWMSAIQGHKAGMGLIDGMSFGKDVFAIIKDKPPGPNEALKIAFSLSFEDQLEKLGACREAHKESGTLKLTVSLDLATRRLRLATAGSLANSALADCVRPLFQAAFDATPVAPEVTGFDEISWPIEMP